MLTHSFTPQAEKTALYNAIGVFRERWEQKHTIDVVFDLCDAIERAEEVCTELHESNSAPQSDLVLVVINLQILIGAARRELARMQNETLEEISHRMTEET